MGQFRSFAFATFALCLAGGAPDAGAQASAPIKIGDINSYSAMALFTEPYRRGAQLAVEELNAAGGVLGRKLEVIFRGDAMKARLSGMATRHSRRRATREA